MKTALTIAGSDSSGGAGIQADIKTMAANGVYAMSAITALTAQNTTGVSDIMEVTPKFLGEQIDSVFTDIRPGAVKIGMVASAQLISKIAEKLKEYDAKNVVVDPVMVATSGAKLISDDAIETLKTELMPLADLLTPNIPEAEVLADMKIGSEDGDGGGGRDHQPEIRLRRSLQGRTQGERCQRSAVHRFAAHLVSRRADRQSQYPRHGMHPFQRYCIESR